MGVKLDLNWNKLSSSILKAELKRRDIGYDELVKLLAMKGVEETRAGIVNKMSRGTFQFAFFLQCASAIGIKNLHIDELIKDGVNVGSQNNDKLASEVAGSS